LPLRLRAIAARILGFSGMSDAIASVTIARRLCRILNQADLAVQSLSVMIVKVRATQTELLRCDRVGTVP
jgi:hypothetical protein